MQSATESCTKPDDTIVQAAMPRTKWSCESDTAARRRTDLTAGGRDIPVPQDILFLNRDESVLLLRLLRSQLVFSLHSKTIHATSMHEERPSCERRLKRGVSTMRRGYPI